MKVRIFLMLLIAFSRGVHAQEITHSHSIFHALIENKGQWDSTVLFQSRTHQQAIWIQQHGFIYDIRDFSAIQKAHAKPTDQAGNLDASSTIVAAHFIGSNTVAKIEKSTPSQHYFNYFIGNNKQKWASNVHSFETVVLKEFYTNIDLKLTDNEQQFKYELWCAPGSNPKQIAIDFKGTNGVSVAKNGDLIIHSALGDIIEKCPIAFELNNGNLTKIACSFVVSENVVRFKLGTYHPSSTVIIDPTLVFATYCGSITDNFGMTATYGYDGTAYSAGTVYGNAYPTPDNLAYDVTSNFTVTNVSNSITTDAFISKYAVDGTTMIWTSFLGGGNNVQGTETSHSLICDQQNNLYIYGVTSSLDFPIVNGYQSTHGGGTALSVAFNGSNFGTAGTDIYVAKLSSNGHTLLGSTYMGGNQNDGVNYKISSANYSSVAAYDSLTTNYGDQFRGEIMLDSVGNCMVASCTRSPNFPVLNAFQSSIAGQQDGVLFKLSNDLSSLQWSSYFGGTNNDACYSVKIDSSYNIVFAGGTSSPNLPATTGALHPNYLGGKADGFVGKLAPNGQTLIRTSYLGTTLYDQTFFVEIDRNDNIYVLGQSMGGLYPIVNATGNPNSGQYISKLSPDLSTLLNATTFGNGNSGINISPSAFLVDICGNMYVSGWGANILQSTPLSGMPVTSNAFQQNPANGFDFYLAVFDRDFSGLLYGSYLGGAAAEEHVDGGTSRFDKNGVVYQSVCGGCGGNSDFPVTPTAWSTQNLSSNCNNLIFKFDFELLPEAQFTTTDLMGCADYQVTFQNTSPSSDSYFWDFGNGDTTSTVYSPTIIYSLPGSYTVTLLVTDSICLLTDTAKITISVYPELELSVSNDTILCSPLPLTFVANSLGTSTSFHWSSNSNFSDQLNSNLSDSTLTITPTQTTTYYVQVANPACSRIDSVTVYFVSGSLEISGNDSICITENSLLTANIFIPGVSFNFTWTPSNAVAPVSANTAQATPTTSGWIYCDAVGSNGCFARDSIFLTVGNLGGVVSATANPDVVLPNGTSVLSALPAGNSYQWTPNTGLSSPTNQITNATVDETTTYTVSVTDGICTQNASVTVKVMSLVCDRTWVFVPNAFSPNSDGVNDVLFVRSAIATDILFRVFDRWGELVFETKDIQTGWDGKFKGKLLDPDTYDYYLEATCIGGDQAIIKGNVTLKR
jgi:gliding motility-associated-like protein